MLYSYLNLESTKTCHMTIWMLDMLYSYLNLESTKTKFFLKAFERWLYSYLNLESTKTIRLSLKLFIGCTVT